MVMSFKTGTVLIVNSKVEVKLMNMQAQGRGARLIHQSLPQAELLKVCANPSSSSISRAKPSALLFILTRHSASGNKKENYCWCNLQPTIMKDDSIA